MKISFFFAERYTEEDINIKKINESIKFLKGGEYIQYTRIDRWI